MAIRTRNHKAYYTDRTFVISTLLGLALFASSIATTWIAGTYATEQASNYVTDIVLSNTPAMNLSGLFVWGTVIFIVFIAGILMLDPKRLPFTMLTLALFFFVRSAFLTFTHLGPFPERDIIDGEIVSRFVLGGDFFFSGHTGAPFLMALIFWRERWLRYVFLIASMVFGAVVLLAHLHYTIDVASAFFITYTIFKIAEYYLPGTRRLFYEGLPSQTHHQHHTH